MKGVKQFFNLQLDFENDNVSVPQGNIDGTDNEKCQAYQWHYIKFNDNDSFIKLWNLFTELCKKAVNKEIRLKHFFLDEEEICYNADIACEYTLRRYKSYKATGRQYVIRNFISAAYHGAKHALYSENENDMFLSFCKELNGKPLREAIKRSSKLAEMDKSKDMKDNENTIIDENQLLLWE